MGATIFSALWLPSSKLPEGVSVGLLPGAAPGRFVLQSSRKRRLLVLFIVVILFSGLLAPAHATELSDREEDGLTGLSNPLKPERASSFKRIATTGRDACSSGCREGERRPTAYGRCDSPIPMISQEGGLPKSYAMRGVKS